MTRRAAPLAPLQPPSTFAQAAEVGKSDGDNREAEPGQSRGGRSEGMVDGGADWETTTTTTAAAIA